MSDEYTPVSSPGKNEIARLRASVDSQVASVEHVREQALMILKSLDGAHRSLQAASELVPESDAKMAPLDNWLALSSAMRRALRTMERCTRDVRDVGELAERVAGEG